MINEKDFVPSGLFGGEPDERRIGFFTKIVELISKSTASKNLYQETSDAIPVNSVLLSGNLQSFPDSLAPTGRRFEWASYASACNYEPEKEDFFYSG